jgi:hypothetical protein
MLVIIAAIADRGNGCGDHVGGINGNGNIDGNYNDGGASSVCGPFTLEVFEEVEVFHHRT